METNKLEDTMTRGEKCLIKLLIDRYHKEALKQTMKEIWRPMENISLRDLGPKLILVEFEGNRDKDCVKRDESWSFEKHLLLVKEEVKGHYNYIKFDLQKLCSWYAYTICH